jgi:hypothetical protein
MTTAIIAAMCVIGVLALAFQVLEPLVEPLQKPAPRHPRRGRSPDHGFLFVP